MNKNIKQLKEQLKQKDKDIKKQAKIIKQQEKEINQFKKNTLANKKKNIWKRFIYTCKTILGINEEEIKEIEKRYRDILGEEKERFNILNGRIYPAIKNCVNNRIILLTGILAYMGFIVLESYKINISNIGFFIKLAPILFIIAALHNLGNYSYNNMEESVFEKRKYISSKYEIVFFSIVLIISVLIMEFLIFDP